MTDGTCYFSPPKHPLFFWNPCSATWTSRFGEQVSTPLVAGLLFHQAEWRFWGQAGQHLVCARDSDTHWGLGAPSFTVRPHRPRQGTALEDGVQVFMAGFS